MANSTSSENSINGLDAKILSEMLDAHDVPMGEAGTKLTGTEHPQPEYPVCTGCQLL